MNTEPYKVMPKRGEPEIARIDGPNYRSGWMALWQANEQCEAMNFSHQDAFAAGPATHSPVGGEELTDEEIERIARLLEDELCEREGVVRSSSYLYYDGAVAALNYARDTYLTKK